ncbi:hypothetical protein, partial [Pseudomonas sp. NCHU5232]|uniref:hypothetical protein n=1 Tax=Pseudomonas sp. NCHU5232 TaxID=3451356 RepID=UPI003F985348
VLVTFAPKVTRPGGRNQKHQQKRGNPEQASNTETTETTENQHTASTDRRQTKNLNISISPELSAYKGITVPRVPDPGL